MSEQTPIKNFQLCTLTNSLGESRTAWDVIAQFTNNGVLIDKSVCLV